MDVGISIGVLLGLIAGLVTGMTMAGQWNSKPWWIILPSALLAGAAGFGLPVWIAASICGRVTHHGEYVGRVFDLSRGGIIWNTMEFCAKTDAQSSIFEGFATQEEAVYKAAEDAARTGAIYRIKYHSTLGYCPWIGDTDVVDAIEPFAEGR